MLEIKQFFSQLLKPLPSMKRKDTSFMSLYFFLVFSAGGIIHPYISLYFHKIGLSGSQIGTIGMVGAFISLMVAPMWGARADRSNHKRFVYQIALLGSGFFMFIVGMLRVYLVVLFIYVGFRFFSASLNPIGETMAMQVARLNLSAKGQKFGSMRLWGSLGWATTSLLGGWLIEKYSIQVNFFVYLVLISITAGSLFLFSKDAFYMDITESLSKVKKSQLEVLQHIWKDKYLLFLVIAMAITHPIGNSIRQFETIYMNQLGISESVIGIAAMLSALIEVPVMYSADFLIAKIGLKKLFIPIFMFDLLRRLAVWVYPTGCVVFAMNLANSITFSLRVVGSVYLVNDRVPKEYATTALSFITITIFGLTNMVSSFLGGYMFEWLGGRYLYLQSAIGMGFSLLLILIAHRKLPGAAPGNSD